MAFEDHVPICHQDVYKNEVKILSQQVLLPWHSKQCLALFSNANLNYKEKVSLTKDKKVKTQLDNSKTKHQVNCNGSKVKV